MAFYGLASAVHKANPDLERKAQGIYQRSQGIDIAIKVVGLALAFFIPQVGLISVIASAIWILANMRMHHISE